MNIILVLCVFLYLGISVNSLHSKNFVDSLINHIANKTNPRYVVLITNSLANSSIRSPIVDDLFPKIVRNFATVRINIEGLNASNTSQPEDEIGHYSIADTSKTFFIIIHESDKIRGLDTLKNTIDRLTGLSIAKIGSNFLLILLSETLSERAEDTLHYAWEKHLFDFTLAEVLGTRKMNGSIGYAYTVNTIPVIHQLNEFKKEYKRINWTSSLEWFPDKVGNMWNHSLKIGVADVRPFLTATFDDHQQPIKVGGANIKLLKIVARMLNFSLEYQPHLLAFMEFRTSRTPEGLYKLMQSGKLDILAYLVPHYIDSIEYNSLRSASVKLDKFCPVVPRLPRKKMPFPIAFFEAYLVSFVIVVVFWTFQRVFRFNGNIWQPFNILRVLFGVAVSRKLKRLSERLLFTGLLIVSAIYSSTIYIALTNISLQKSGEMQFDSYEDLINSGLTPMINNFVYNKTFRYAEGPLIELMKKTVIIEGIMNGCLEKAAKSKNVFCIMSLTEARALVQESNQGSRLKIGKACLWSDSIGFLLGSGSPYRPRIDEAVRKIQSSGLLNKLYRSGSFNLSRTSKNVNAEENAGLDSKENMNALRQQLLAIAVVGYSVSLLVFAMEILVDRVTKYRRGSMRNKIENR